jgi:radical SAM protein with 4Fe4S-binding SPASM domain
MINARQDGSDLTTRSMMLRGERLRALLREGLQRGELLPQQQGQRWQDGHPCFACKRGMSVGADGRWMVCTGFDLALGKVTEQRLAQVTGTPEASFWAELTWNGVHGCRDCELLRYCHRCHADALLQAGDLLGPYDPACAMTRAVYAEATGRSSELASRCRAEPVGPFRLVAGGLEQLPDLMTAHDMSVRERFSWVLRQVDKKAAPKHTSGMTWERRS